MEINEELYKALVASTDPAKIDDIIWAYQVSNLATLLHTALCTVRHNTKDCDFYVSELVDEKPRAITLWEGKAEGWLKQAAITSPAELREIIDRFVRVITLPIPMLRFTQVILPDLIIAREKQSQAARPVAPLAFQPDPSGSASPSEE